MTSDHQHLVAIVDSSPVLMLPSTLACRERFPDRPLHVSLIGPMQVEGAMERLVRVLARHEIEARVHPRADSLEAGVRDWLASLPPDTEPIIDVSAASGGAAARALLTLREDTSRHHRLCWFQEANNEVHFSNGGAPDAYVFDMGSRKSARSAVTPVDFMAIFGLERASDDPYCGIDHARLVPIAIDLLRLTMTSPQEYREFRRVLAIARARTQRAIPTNTIPDPITPVVQALAQFDGWLRSEGGCTVLGGTRSTRGVFFLSGGWLEVAVAEAIRRALPDHRVQMNCGTTWGRKWRAEAEMDVAFVYQNALYLLSCKNDHLTDRFFPHLDRFRALTAEFGESRTRPVLLSTAELEPRHIRRCDAYEIAQLSGRTLLETLARSLTDEPDHLLKALLTVSRGAPRAGIA